MQQGTIPSLFEQAAERMDLPRGYTAGSRGPIVAAITAPRDISMSYGHDVYAGQVCFLQHCRLFEGIHAIRYRGAVTVCRVSFIPGRQLRLSWMDFKEDGVTVERSEVEHLGAVVGCYSGDSDPVLWMYSN